MLYFYFFKEKALALEYCCVVSTLLVSGAEQCMARDGHYQHRRGKGSALSSTKDCYTNIERGVDTISRAAF